MTLRSMVLGQLVVLDHGSFMPTVVNVIEALELRVEDEHGAVVKNPPVLPVRLMLLTTWLRDEDEPDGEYEFDVVWETPEGVHPLTTDKVSFGTVAAGPVIRFQARTVIQNLPYVNNGDYILKVVRGADTQRFGEWAVRVKLDN